MSMQLATEKTMSAQAIRAKAHDVAKALQRLRGVAGSKSLYPYSNYVLFKKSAEHRDKIYLYAFDGVTQISSCFAIDPEANSGISDEFSFLVLEKGLPNLLKMLNNDDEVTISYNASDEQIDVYFYENKYTFPCATLDKYDVAPYQDINGTAFKINANAFYKIIEQLEPILNENKNNFYGIFLEIVPTDNNQFKIVWMTTDAQFMIVNEVVPDIVVNYNNNDNKFVINPSIIYSIKNSLDKNGDSQISFIVNSKLCSVETENVRLVSINPSIKFVPKDIVASRLVKFFSFVFSIEALRDSLKRLYSIYKTNSMLNFQIIGDNIASQEGTSNPHKSMMIINASNFDESMTGQDAIEINVLDSKNSQSHFIKFMMNGVSLKEIAKTLDDGEYVFTINENKNLGLLQRFDSSNEDNYNTYVYIALQTN